MSKSPQFHKGSSTTPPKPKQKLSQLHVYEIRGGKVKQSRVFIFMVGNKFAKKNNRLDNGQGRYFNLQAENTTDFNSISTHDMDCQSVNNLFV
jgi:hypothetical protein